MQIPNMIDTIRFKTYCNYELWANIEDAPQTKRIVKIENDTQLEKERLESFILFPPFNTKLTLLAYNYDTIYLEGSLPKLEYGTNVRMLYPSQVEPLLRRIWKALLDQYGDFPPPQTWQVQRLDMCYNYKFPTQERATDIMIFLQIMEYPKKDKHIYKKESVSFTARIQTIKFYLKHKEFDKKDYKLLSVNNPTLAEEMLELSKGILRFEVELKRAELKQLLNKSSISYEDILDISFYYKTLNKYLETLLKNKNKMSMDYFTILDLLKKEYGEVKGQRLFYFYVSYYHPEQEVKMLMKQKVNATTISKTLKEISYAGVGLPVKGKYFYFDLSIPNNNVVDPEPAPPALAEERVDSPSIFEIKEEPVSQLSFEESLDK
jgi:replication protein CRI